MYIEGEVQKMIDDANWCSDPCHDCSINETCETLRFAKALHKMKYKRIDEESDEEMLPENCLHIKGWLSHDYNDIIATTESLNGYHANSIISQIEDYAEKNGFIRKLSKGLGGTQSFIRNCNIRIYFTKKKCSLCQAQMQLDERLYSGDLATETSNIGYSEYTITGLILDEFTIGGHDLNEELESHRGEYIHMIMECKD